MVTDETGKAFVNLIPIGEKTGNNYGIPSGSIDQYLTDIVVTPNPLTNASVLEYTLLQDQLVFISVFDMLGRKVQDVLFEKQTSGSYSIPLYNLPIQSGMYVLNVGLLDGSMPIKIIKP